MSTPTPVLMIIFVFLFFPLVLAEFARKKSLSTIENFFLQDREMPLYMVFFTVYSTWVSSFAILGSSSYFYTMGPVYMTAFAWNALFAVLFMILGRRIWYYGKMNGYLTPTDFFQDIYDSKTLNLLVTIILLAFTLPYLLIQLSGGAYLIESATGGMIDWRMSGLLFYLIIIIYLWAGGLRAVALADIFYGILIFISMLAVGFYMMSKAGGVELVFEKIMEQDQSNVVLKSEGGQEKILFWLSMFVVVPLGALMGPQLWIRFYAVKEEKAFKIMPLLLTFAAIMYLGSILTGTAGIILMPDIAIPDTLIPMMILKYAPDLLSALFFCGIASGALSTANSQIHAIAAIYTIDIHKRYFNPHILEKKLVGVGKWSVLLISLLAYLLLLKSPVLIVNTGIIAMGGTAQIFIPTLGGLFWKKSNPKAAIFGLIVGLGTLTILVVFARVNAAYVGVISLAINGLVFVVGSQKMKSNIKTREKIISYQEAYNNRFY
ncbi:MAG: sodium:solute symporter family protein [Anaerovoracaceae bacterium]|jgi:SSS family solute:Na+ symporter